MKLIDLRNGTIINAEDISSIYEEQGGRFSSVFITMKTGKDIKVSHEHKAAFKESLKELTK